MSGDEKRDEPVRRGERPPRRVRIPGFVPDEEIGLGDAVKRVTYTMGIRRPCGGCERRAAALNRRVVLSRAPGHGQ
ncbi:hypothetical protein [Kitasatospora sp. NPDC057223]|uniref:hypothetical protein n=1 Tax=Kitasatospora sp. NPDC057223 TaxID=3346055 RepID=UPI0036346A1D